MARNYGVTTGEVDQMLKRGGDADMAIKSDDIEEMKAGETRERAEARLVEKPIDEEQPAVQSAAQALADATQGQAPTLVMARCAPFIQAGL